jgi:hypothetical protein
MFPVLLPGHDHSCSNNVLVMLDEEIELSPEAWADQGVVSPLQWWEEGAEEEYEATQAKRAEIAAEWLLSGTATCYCN